MVPEPARAEPRAIPEFRITNDQPIEQTVHCRSSCDSCRPPSDASSKAGRANRTSAPNARPDHRGPPQSHSPTPSCLPRRRASKEPQGALPTPAMNSNGPLNPAALRLIVRRMRAPRVGRRSRHRPNSGGSARPAQGTVRGLAGRAAFRSRVHGQGAEGQRHRPRRRRAPSAVVGRGQGGNR